MDNITENNKLIAEFLVKNEGGLVKLKENIFSTIDEFEIPDDYLTLKDLKYHKNWNLLMAVVEKIKGLISESEFIYRFKESLFKFNINNVWLSCIEFIKWYNEQK